MDKSVCGCEQSKSWPKPSKYYQEVGAELLGNKILVRIERDKNKLNKLKKLKEKSKDWDPPCVCTALKLKPLKESRVQGPKIITVGKNEIVFRLNSRCRLSCEDQNYSSQVISSSNYNFEAPRPEQEDNKIQVFSQLDRKENHDVCQDHGVVEEKNLFLMKVNKKSVNIRSNFKDFGAKKIELEVSYPKFAVPSAPPSPSPPPPTPPKLIPLPEVKVSKVKVTKAETKKRMSKAKKKK